LFFICLLSKKQILLGNADLMFVACQTACGYNRLHLIPFWYFRNTLATLLSGHITTTPKGKIMKNVSTFGARLALVAAIAAAGAAPMAAQASPEHHSRNDASHCSNCGTVVSTHTYERAAERGSGVGAAGGAVLGGLLGNQVGSGRGRTLATIAGAVGGGYAGNHVERNMHSVTYTDVRVRMAAGGFRTFTEQGRPRFANGDHVRVQQGRLVR
jgi:outer membrane lipoprotein SlyB